MKRTGYIITFYPESMNNFQDSFNKSRLVYNNKVYVTGGFDPGTSPYNWGETWVYDPMAPYGSRWTHLASANLSIPRAYMSGAVMDGKIYAIGGNYYTGSSLVNVNTVEVLDLSAPTPTWPRGTRRAAPPRSGPRTRHSDR